MSKKFPVIIITLLLLSSCVSQKKYNDMYALWVYADGQYHLIKDRIAIDDKNWKLLLIELERYKKDSSSTDSAVFRLRREIVRMDSAHKAYVQLTESEKGKLKSSINVLETDIYGLNRQVEIRNVSLKLKSEKIRELEFMLHRKDSIMRATHDRLTKALLGFKEQGVNVHVVGGKVYISMDERLLFQSGQIDVNPEGKNALKEISKVLNIDSTTMLTIEGHTDDVPFHSSTKPYKDNWDISVLRATSVIRFMQNTGMVSPKRITAAGRAEYFPLDPGKTPEARKRNRRIEIIVSPDLDEIARLLNNN